MHITPELRLRILHEFDLILKSSLPQYSDLHQLMILQLLTNPGKIWDNNAFDAILGDLSVIESKIGAFSRKYPESPFQDAKPPEDYYTIIRKHLEPLYERNPPLMRIEKERVLLNKMSNLDRLFVKFSFNVSLAPSKLMEVDYFLANFFVLAKTFYLFAEGVSAETFGFTKISYHKINLLTSVQISEKLAFTQLLVGYMPRDFERVVMLCPELIYSVSAPILESMCSVLQQFCNTYKLNIAQDSIEHKQPDTLFLDTIEKLDLNPVQRTQYIKQCEYLSNLLYKLLEIHALELRFESFPFNESEERDIRARAKKAIQNMSTIVNHE